MKYINDMDVSNKKVIVRVDYNVPVENGVVVDNNRIKQSLETINYLIDNNAKVILLSHLGKIKTLEDKEKNDMKYVLPELEKLLGKSVSYSSVTRGRELEEKVNKLNNGDVLLVQNTRYEDLDNKKESECDEELSKYWASLCDLFVMDAFGSAHRGHASTYGIAKYKESSIGFLMKKEMSVLDEILNNDKKTLILGGSKVSDKIKMIENLAGKSNSILIGGLMAMPFLKVNGFNTGAHNISEEEFEAAKSLLQRFGEKIILPVDFYTSKKEGESSVLKSIKEFQNDDLEFDIGDKTIELFTSELFKSTMIFWNGPVGMFENNMYQKGTMKLLDLLSDFNAKVVIAGGDTASAAKKAMLESCFTISTGGGASLEYLSSAEFPIISLLNNN